MFYFPKTNLTPQTWCSVRILRRTSSSVSEPNIRLTLKPNRRRKPASVCPNRVPSPCLSIAFAMILNLFFLSSRSRNQVQLLKTVSGVSGVLVCDVEQTWERACGRGWIREKGQHDPGYGWQICEWEVSGHTHLQQPLLEIRKQADRIFRPWSERQTDDKEWSWVSHRVTWLSSWKRWYLGTYNFGLLGEQRGNNYIK